MRRAFVTGLVAVLPWTAGCALLPLASALPKDDEVTVLTTEEGTKYIHVASQRNASQAYLRGRWKREARKTCRGDYMVVSEDRTERRTEGRVKGRTHEGYVRCVDPEATMDGEGDTKAAAARTPSQS